MHVIYYLKDHDFMIEEFFMMVSSTLIIFFLNKWKKDHFDSFKPILDPPNLLISHGECQQELKEYKNEFALVGENKVDN